MTVSTCYRWGGTPNFGDVLTRPLVVRYFPGMDFTEDADCATFFATGSVLQELFPAKRRALDARFRAWRTRTRRPRACVWGSGFLCSQLDYARETGRRVMRNVQDLDLFALRGPLSATLLRGLGVSVPNNLPFGDPGLLYPELLESERQEPSHDLALMPHVSESREPYHAVIERLRGVGVNAILLDPCAEPMGTLRELARCETLIASALHGLIVADALGIPNAWLADAQWDAYRRFKYLDYYAGLGIPAPTPWGWGDLMADSGLPNRIRAAYTVAKSAVAMAQEGLRQAAALIREKGWHP